MLTFEQIKELIELVAERDLDGLKVERSGFSLAIRGKKKAKPVVAAPAVSAAPMVVEAAPQAAAPTPIQAAAPAANEPAETSAGPDIPEDAHILHSPIVGTFYRAPSPEADLYVELGSRVKVGQNLCIVEAMKVMNEIESDAAGEIVHIFPENGQPVEYGEPLFAIRAS